MPADPGQNDKQYTELNAFEAAAAKAALNGTSLAFVK
jgi:hypothetical protein